MREFLKETGLETAKISLDAPHCNPETMTQIEQADGVFLIQVKENQPKLLEHYRVLAEQTPLAETIEHACGHGLITSRQAQLHNVQVSAIKNRWQQSGLRTLVVMNREPFNQASQKTGNETAYYLSIRSFYGLNQVTRLPGFRFFNNPLCNKASSFFSC